MNQLELAKGIAIAAHRGQYRRDGNTPYIMHPEAVAAKLVNETEEVQAIAWLHDVLEDTDETPSSLHSKGVTESIIMSVVALTKNDEPYMEYLHCIRNDRNAAAVKIADMLHNLSDSPTPKQIVKYCKGLLYLLNAA